MLHLVIIGIVCAVSALSESTATIRGKNYKANAFCHFDEGARNGAKTALPGVYDVDAYNSSLSATGKVTRTASFVSDSVIKKCEKRRNIWWKVMENVSPGKGKESPDEDVGPVFRKRNLLWEQTNSGCSPNTVRPPTETPVTRCYACEYMKMWQVKCKEPKKDKCNNECTVEIKTTCKGKCKGKGKGKCKNKCKSKSKGKNKCKSNKKKCKKVQEPQTNCECSGLTCKEKKQFLRLKKYKGCAHKRHLDSLKVDDELDLNKRIQKLVEEIAVENQRMEPSRTGLESEEDCGEDASQTPKGKHSFMQKIKKYVTKLNKVFSCKKNECVKGKGVNKIDNTNKNNKINEYNTNNKQSMYKMNIIPVNIVRGKHLVADKAALINSFDVKTRQKANRFRRNLPGNWMSYSHGSPIHRYGGHAFVKPHPHSGYFQGKASFLNPYSIRRLTPNIRRRRRLKFDHRRQLLPLPYVKHTTGKDFRYKRHKRCPFKRSMKSDDEAGGKENTAEGLEKATEKVTLDVEDKAVTPAQEERTDADGRDVKEQSGEDEEKNLPDHTLEKPFLERDFRYDVSGEKNILQRYEDRYNLQTDFPLFDSAYLPYLRYKNEKLKGDFLNPYRYLRIRHALRNYLIHNNILLPTSADYAIERKKRCGAKCCPMPRKCWRSPPLLCIPYIKKGQDDLLRYLIKTLQKMVGRPFPPKLDIFESTKYKPCPDKAEDPPPCPDDDDCEVYTMSCLPPCMPEPPPCMPEPTCMPQMPCMPCPMPSSPCPCSYASNSKLYPSQMFLPKTRARFSPLVPGPIPFNGYNALHEYEMMPSDLRPSGFSDSNPNMDRMPYYDETTPFGPLAFHPSSPEYQSFVSSTESLARPPSFTGQISESRYAPRSATNVFPRFVEQTPSAYTQPQYPGTPSTMNACSWYLSKSPLEKAEYFSYTALPYQGPSETATTASHLVQSEPLGPVNDQPVYQTNAENPSHIRTVHTQRMPDQLMPAEHVGTPPENFMYDNLCRERHKSAERPPTEMYSQQSGVKDNSGRRTDEMEENSSKESVVRCEQQQNQIRDQNPMSDQNRMSDQNQMQKSDTNYMSEKNDQNKEIVQTGYKCSEVQESSNNHGETAPVNKGQMTQEMYKMSFPQSSQNAGQSSQMETNANYNKNMNKEETYRCPFHQFCSKMQTVSKPEAIAKYPKNLSKEEGLKCNEQQRSSNLQQLKPEENYDNDEKRFFKTKHYKSLLRTFRRPAMEFTHSFDDYFDRFPLLDPDDDNSFRHRAPFPRTWRGYSRKVKKHSKRSYSVRRKRNDGDIHSSPVNVNNNAVVDNPGSSDEAPPDPNWTPPSYEMFSELAKAVTETNNNSSDMSSESTTSGTTESIEGKSVEKKTRPGDAGITVNSTSTASKIVSKPTIQAENPIKINSNTAVRNDPAKITSGRIIPKKKTDNTTAAGSDKQISAAGPDKLTSAAGLNKATSAAVLNKTTGAAGPDKQISAAGSDKPNNAAGSDKPNNAAGSDKPTNAAGPDKPTSAAGPDKQISAAGSDKPTSAAGPDKQISAAGSDKPTNAAGPDKQISAAGSDKQISAAGTDKPTNAAGPDKPTSAAGLDKPTNAAGLNKATSAAGSDKPTNAAGPDKPTNAAGLNKATSAAGSDKPTNAAGPDKPTNAAGLNKATSAAVLNKTTSAAGPDKPTTATTSTTAKPTLKATTAAPLNSTTAAASNKTVSVSSNSTVAVSANTSAAATSDGCVNGDSFDSKKSGKTSFFQSNSKTVGIQSNPKALTPSKLSRLGSGREDKDLDENQERDLDGSDEGQIPTTLKTANIVKGPKKLMTKPCPKTYTRVFPDSFPFEAGAFDMITPATAKSVAEKATSASGSFPNAQLQLLAVCEGYLEVVKLIKAQNQTLWEDLDTDLARYCENIISQNFNLQSDSSKPKKQESVTSSPPSMMKTSSTTTQGTEPQNDSSFNAAVTSEVDDVPENEITEQKLQDRSITDILEKKIPDETTKKKKKKKKRHKYVEDEDGNEKTETSDGETEPRLPKKKNNATHKTSRKADSKSHHKKRKRYRRKEQVRGITKAQQELLQLLSKRKTELLAWLYNTKELGSKSNDETEYFNDEDEIPEDVITSSCSGTITRKEHKDTLKPKKKEWSFPNETTFPVYAKQYGYDRGGQLTEVEVLWRKINEKTHERQIFKNLSVLALLLPGGPRPCCGESQILGSNFEGDEMAEIQSKGNYPGIGRNLSKKSTTVRIKMSPKNKTCTIISKPDPKFIVGTPPNATMIAINASRKTSHKFGAAKDLFQEYTLEFLNYAVYILPIMFTILFFFCCLCCAVQVLKSRNPHKKYKKMKKQVSTESETSGSERGSTKKCRRKKHSKENMDYEALDKKKCRAFWNALKLSSGKSCSECNEETEKKRSFLRFLRSKRDEDKAEFSARYATVEEQHCCGSHDSDPQCSRRKKDEKGKNYSQSEAEERRELIALLEELKKIETENTGDKKEVKSVHVQYMTQEDDRQVFQRPEFAFPYQKNVFGMPKGCSPCKKHFSFYQSDPATVRDYELFDDVNELSELLPCDCKYYPNRNDCLRQCDFKINEKDGCKSLVKIFRDAGVSRNKEFGEKNLFRNENDNRSYIYNRYRGADEGDELPVVTQKDVGAGVTIRENVYESASPLALPSNKSAGSVEETDSLKRQLNNKKHVRLKDNGVLCRL